MMFKNIIILIIIALSNCFTRADAAYERIISNNFDKFQSQTITDSKGNYGKGAWLDSTFPKNPLNPDQSVAAMKTIMGDVLKQKDIEPDPSLLSISELLGYLYYLDTKQRYQTLLSGNEIKREDDFNRRTAEIQTQIQDWRLNNKCLQQVQIQDWSSLAHDLNCYITALHSDEVLLSVFNAITSEQTPTPARVVPLNNGSNHCQTAALLQVLAQLDTAPNTPILEDLLEILHKKSKSPSEINDNTKTNTPKEIIDEWKQLAITKHTTLYIRNECNRTFPTIPPTDSKETDIRLVWGDISTIIDPRGDCWHPDYLENYIQDYNEKKDLYFMASYENPPKLYPIQNKLIQIPNDTPLEAKDYSDADKNNKATNYIPKYGSKSKFIIFSLDAEGAKYRNLAKLLTNAPHAIACLNDTIVAYELNAMVIRKFTKAELNDPKQKSYTHFVSLIKHNKQWIKIDSLNPGKVETKSNFTDFFQPDYNGNQWLPQLALYKKKIIKQ